jgi:hypothetical protein
MAANPKRADDPRCMRLDRAIAGLPPVEAKAPADVARILPFAERAPMTAGSTPVIVSTQMLAEHAARVETLQGTVAALTRNTETQAETIAALKRALDAAERALADADTAIVLLRDLAAKGTRR